MIYLKKRFCVCRAAFYVVGDLMNKEKYKDPTAERAIANVMKQRRKQEGGMIGKKSEPESKRSGATISYRDEAG